jgi:hypothetical protein
MKIGEALAAPAMIPVPASSPAVVVTIAAMDAAHRRVGFTLYRSLQADKLSTHDHVPEGGHVRSSVIGR